MRERTPSFAYTLVRVDSMVRTVTTSSGGNLLVGAAIRYELGDAPLDRGQLSPPGGAAADPRELGARSLDPDGCAELLEDRERLPERLPGCAPLPRAPLRRAEREKRPRALERHRSSLVLAERLLEGDNGAVEVGLLGCDQAVTASGGRPGGRSIERRTTVLVPREHGLRLLEPSEGHECLDVVGNEAHRRAPEQAAVRVPGNEWPEVRGPPRPLEGDREESERPGGNALHERCVRADGDLECSLAGFAGCACAPEMGLDQGSRLARINAVFAGCPAWRTISSPAST